MIITSSLQTYSEKGLESLIGKIDQKKYQQKANRSRAVPFEITPESLQAVFAVTRDYIGEIYDTNGKKTESYHKYKSMKLRALWFVNDMNFRPTSFDYHKWDGHILLDLDNIKETTADMIYQVLIREKPNWFEMVKRSGSGSLHILCKTVLEPHHKAERHFQAVFDTFTTLLNKLLNDNGLRDVVPDKSMRKVSQGMALWNTDYYINNANNGFNVFGTPEYVIAETTLNNNETVKNTQLSNNTRRINDLIANNFHFTYDTKNARSKIWQPHGDGHARFKERIAVVIALRSLGVSEEETYSICQFGFEDEGLAEVRGYYHSSNGVDPRFIEHNLRILQEYLNFCHIQYSLRPVIVVDENIKPLHVVDYDLTIPLGANDHIVGNWVKEDRFLTLLETLDKDVLYLNAAPGVGKTEMAKSLITKMHKRVCVCCGRNTVFDGKFDGIDVVRCYGKSIKGADLKDKKRSLVCSLDWFSLNFKEHIYGKGYDFIIMDEIHLTDEHYRKKTMMAICTIIKNFPANHEKLILMTATPSIETNYLPKNRTYHVKVEKIRLHNKTLTPVISPDYQTSLDAMIADVTNAVESGKKVFIVENDTHRNAVLTDYFQQYDIKLVNFNRKNKGDQYVQFILKNSKIPKGFDGLIITSYLGVGNEVFEKNELEVFFIPSIYSHFTSNEIEQYANRIRNQNLSAKIYYNEKSFLCGPQFIQGHKTWTEDTLMKQYDEMMLIKNADTTLFYAIEPIIQIHKEDVFLYERCVFQHSQYEMFPSNVLSLLHNEYGWIINDTVYHKDSLKNNMQESRKRVSEANNAKMEEAIKYMYQHYLFETVDDKDERSIMMIAKGIKDSYVELRYDGESVFALKMTVITSLFNEYHRLIANDIIDFGGWVTLAYMAVMDKKLTLNDLITILTRCRLYRDLECDVLPFLEKCSLYLQTAKLPFNHNTISREHKRDFEAFVSSVLPYRPTAIVPKLVEYVIRLSKRSDDGCLILDLNDYQDPCDNAMEEVESYIEKRRERLRTQKKASRERCKQKKRSNAANGHKAETV